MSSGPTTVQGLGFRPVVNMSGSRTELDFSASFSSGGLTSSPQLLPPTQTSPPQPTVQASSFQPIRPLQPTIFAQAPVFTSDVYRYTVLSEILYLRFM